MKTLLLLSLIALSVISCQAEKIEVDEFQECKEVIGSYHIEDADPQTGLIEGDIIPDMIPEGKGFVISAKDKIWKDNIVPFFFNEGLSEQQKEHIRSRQRHIMSVTNIIFIEFENEVELRKSYQNGIHFRPPISPFAGNSSHVGMQPDIQNLTLVSDAPSLVIDHEIFHALGHEHEHTRPDRDAHIIVDYDNIPVNPTLKRQFDIRDNGSIPCGPYDTKSAMHYYGDVGTSNVAIREGKLAITDLDGNEIPKPKGLSPGDIEANKILYPKHDG